MRSELPKVRYNTGIVNRGGESVPHHHHGENGWNREQLAGLDRPEREDWMPKAPVLAALAVKEGDAVADVGAGLGYFALPLVAMAGENGQVYAIDPSQDAVEELRLRASEAHLSLTVIQRGAEDTGLEAASLDKVLWHTMYHDVQDLGRSVRESARILKPGGLWVIVDWKPDPMEKGPPLEVRVSPEMVSETVAPAGFTLLSEFLPSEVTWGMVWQRQ